MSKLFADLIEKQSSPPPPAPGSSSALPDKRHAPNAEPTESEKEPSPIDASNPTTTPRYHDTTKPGHHDPMPPRDRESMDAQYDGTQDRLNQGRLIETICKAVKQIGKESATHRFTLEEKKALADIIYTYKTQGIKTNENEIARIGLNFLMEDYHAHGEASILAGVLEKLNE